MESLSNLLTTDTDNNSLINKYKTTDINTTDNNLSTDSLGYWTDRYVDVIYADLTNQKFRGWYCKVFYKLGKTRVEGIAQEARGGRHPQRLFSCLLKEADLKFEGGEKVVG